MWLFLDLSNIEENKVMEFGQTLTNIMRMGNKFEVLLANFSIPVTNKDNTRTPTLQVFLALLEELMQFLPSFNHA